MKKTYITPALHVEQIQVELPIAVSNPTEMTKSADPAKAITNETEILTKDRGEYGDDTTFGDLW
ncbi:MAG: hypothetical protein IJV06_00365 [Bacteroidaceae bacterium]|nr:hypothetical protein [Bacteroidaceae bacterium]